MQRFILSHAGHHHLVAARAEEEIMKRYLCWFMVFILSNTVYAETRMVNVYAYTGEIPDYLVRQFEKETGIKVNFSTYENNEIMYAKIRASKRTGYDVIMPSSYFVDRMSRQNILLKLDKDKLPNRQHLAADFLHPAYDPNGDYSVPVIWGITGIFYNNASHDLGKPSSWNDLWDKRYYNKLMLLDDSREVFSMALLTLGYSANDSDPAHIKQAFEKLKTLMPNVKVFSTDTVVSILIDEDATIGMAWNGDTFKATQENPNVKFVFPKEGFVIWVDNFSIPANAPHPDEAYAFINFFLRPDIAKTIALYTHFPITNQSGQQLLPPDIRNNPFVYPSKEILKHGQFQKDLSDDTLALYEQYWEELKMSG
jgi:spermidine/putrescine transport system substrate-binding protein